MDGFTETISGSTGIDCPSIVSEAISGNMTGVHNSKLETRQNSLDSGCSSRSMSKGKKEKQRNELFTQFSIRHSVKPHSITSKQALTDLYNTNVASIEHVTRPLGGSGGALGRKHSGVVLTTTSGDRWLVHKGSGYGNSSETVVADAKNMSEDWKTAGTKPARPGTRVADYVKAGGSHYNLLFDNCHDGSGRMMKVAKDKEYHSM